MTSDHDQRGGSSGRFAKGRSGNPNGRPKKGRSVDQAILKAANETVPIIENGRRRRLRKIDAVAKQVLNRGAGGDPRSAKLALDFAQKAEDRAAAAPAPAAHLSASDEEIVERLMARLERLWKEKADGPDHAL